MIFEILLPSAYIPIYYHSIGRQVTKGHTKICFGATFWLENETAKSKQLNRTQRTDCLLMQPVSIEVQHCTSPSKYADLDGVARSIRQVILCVFSKYYRRLNCHFRVAFRLQSEFLEISAIYLQMTQNTMHFQISPFDFLCVLNQISLEN